MTWNKVKKTAALGLAAAMLAGSVLSAGAAEVGSEATDADVKFKAGEIVNPPVGPPDDKDDEEEPGPVYPPIGTKSLQLVHTPSLDFGEVKVSTEAKDYYAKAQYLKNKEDGSERYAVNYMKVIDVRGNNHGWNVKVKMDGVFTATENTAVTKTLEGAAITFDSSEIATESSAAADTVNGFPGTEVSLSGTSGEVTMMQAPAGAGSGIWYQEFGTNSKLAAANSDGESFTENGMPLLFNPNIRLNIPAKVMPDSGIRYTTELVWTLSDAP